MNAEFKTTEDTLPESEHVGYVEACARKQLGLSADDAAAHVGKLPAGYVPAIRAAGRVGNTARVVELLNGAPLDDAPAPAKKGKGKKADAAE